MSLPFLRTLQGDRFFQLLILVGIGLSFFVPFAPKSWPAAIDWHTIITLSGLMLLTKGVELSGYFDVLGRKMVRRFATERRLAMFMVLAAALLSTFLTNDVALFIVVPLTITLKRLCEIPVNRLIIFEALAVNAGSLLTPIGNPQNILIWGRSGLSFAGFIAQMAPLAGAMMLNAEEMGINSQNVDEKAANPATPDMAHLLGKEGDYGKDLKLDNKWAYNIIKQVGNYSEIFERNVGSESPLKIKRGQNNLWNNGGIQYAPPVR